MRRIKFIVRKEFLQFSRNKPMLAVIFIAPLLQLLLLSYVATFDIKDIDLVIIDQDHSPSSRELIQRFDISENFRIVKISMNQDDGIEAIDRNKAKMAIHLPQNMGRDLTHESSAAIGIQVDAVDGFTANIARQYAMGIIQKHNRQLQPVMEQASSSQSQTIGVEVARWYNPDLNYKAYMVPGILIMLVTSIGAFLTSMNIVREQEIGTIEQINVTPIRKSEFIIGKLLPFWIMAIIVFSLGLVAAWLLFDIPFVGSLWTIYALALGFLLLVIGAGLLVSTISNTQQQALFSMWFIFVIFVLLSGLFTPIDSMPGWAQYIALLNPVTWFIDMMRRVMLTGTGFSDIAVSYFVLLGLAAAIIALAVARFRKVSG